MQATPEALTLHEAHRNLDAAQANGTPELVEQMEKALAKAEEVFDLAMPVSLPHDHGSIDMPKMPAVTVKRALSMAHENVKVLREQNKALHEALKENVRAKKVYNNMIIPNLKEMKKKEMEPEKKNICEDPGFYIPDSDDPTVTPL